MSDNKKPHIQMPKFIMKRFAHRNAPIDGKTQPKTVYVLDLSDYRIKEECINHLGTGEEGYYPKDLEDYFASLEGLFGNIQLKVNEFARMEAKGEPFELTVYKKEEADILRFIDMIFGRSETATKLFNENNAFYTAFGRDLTKIEYNYMVSNFNIASPSSNSFEKTHKIAILLNQTKKEFVAPRNVYYVDWRGNLIIPISPKAAIVAVPIGADDRYYALESEQAVLEFNQAALIAEEKLNNCFLIARREEELHEIREYALQRKTQNASHDRYIGKTMTYEQAYFAFQGYNYVMTDLEENERGTNYKGRVVCVSNDTFVLQSAIQAHDGKHCALMQGKMEDIDIPEIALGRALVSG